MGHDAPTAFGRRDLTSCRGVGCSNHLEKGEERLHVMQLYELIVLCICCHSLLLLLLVLIFISLLFLKSPPNLIPNTQVKLKALTLGAVWNGHSYILATIIVLGFGR